MVVEREKDGYKAVAYDGFAYYRLILVYVTWHEIE